MDVVIMNKLLISQFTSHYGIKLIESGLFDDDTFEQYSPREVQQLSGSNRSNLPVDLDELYASFIEITTDFDQKLLSKNSRYFSKSIGLPTNASSLIEFIIVGTLKPIIFRSIEQFITKSAYSYSDAFTVLLGLGEIELEECLEALESIGLYKNRIFDYELPLLPKSLAHYLFTSHQYRTKDALGLFLKNEEPASYNLSSFGHRDTLHLKSLLNGWKRSSNSGLNILIYGAVGTGKSELAKSLCSNAELVLMKVKSSSEVDAQVEKKLGTKSSTSYRIHNLSMARRLMGERRDGVLLIDECEDIFDVNMFGSSEPKELLHSLIEEPNGAAIWITNHIEDIPESCVRRFDFVLEMPQLTKKKRLEHVLGYFNELKVSLSFIEKVVSNKHLNLANISKASHGASLCGYESEAAQEFIDSYVEGVMAASGIDLNQMHYKPELKFDHTNINLKGSFSNLNDITNALNNHHGARTLLFGPAGTGKTAFVNHVCQEAGFELISVQASDILSKWVGESEQNIKNLFIQATEEGAAIFIDEADSLFSSREGATNSWEVQSVNQLLCNLEMFELPFFAATNFKKRLDKALLRRCDFKLELDYLIPEQVSRMILKLTGKKTLGKSETAKLVGLDRITPGDFTVIARKMRFLNKAPTPIEVLEFLFEEQKLKGDCKRRIGF